MTAMRFLLILIGLFAVQPAWAQEKRIALTFDDIPRAPGAFLTPDERAVRLIAALRRAGVEQAAFFVNPAFVDGVDDRPGAAERMDAYAAAGHVLANHSATHARLSDTGAAAYLADIDRAEAWLKDRPERRPWFRFPYLDEGRADTAKRDAIRAGLDARGLTNGYVTVDGSDWNIEALTIAARRDGKAIDMAALRDLYVETHVESAEFADALARRALGRSPAHVLLLHETDIAALFVADLVAGLRARGWAIVTADEAYRDPLTRAEPDVPSANGLLIQMIATEKGVAGPLSYDRNDTRIADALFRTRVLKEAE